MTSSKHAEYDQVEGVEKILPEEAQGAPGRSGPSPSRAEVRSGSVLCGAQVGLSSVPAVRWGATTWNVDPEEAEDGPQQGLAPPQINTLAAPSVERPVAVEFETIPVAAEPSKLAGWNAAPAGADQSPEKDAAVHIVKVPMTTALHAEIVALKDHLGCLNNGEIYRHLVRLGLEQVRRQAGANGA